MDFYKRSAEEALEGLESSREGLSSQRAAALLAEKGRNKLKEGEKISLLSRFLKQMSDPMIIILLCAALVSGLTAFYSGEPLTDVFIILAVVLLNATLGVVQESKAEKAIEALNEMSAPESRVLRDGRPAKVLSEDIVPGDIILLEAGDAVPADARLIECASLKCEEAALTGESVPVSKQTEALEAEEGRAVPLGDRSNMVYMGSSVAYGRARAVVCATGMETEMGKIAEALTQAKENKTPLQIKLAQLSKTLTWLVLGVCVFIFAYGALREGSFTLDSMLSSFMIAVSLAVAAIPEGLAAVVTIVLSIGVTKMSKHNAVIRRLTAVETLGCTQIICSDKTGTLTQNRMTVLESSSFDQEQTARAMALCSDAYPGADGQAEGEPTECALVNYAASLGLKKPELEAKLPRVGEAPFDSMRKLMSTVHERGDGTCVQYTKGAPDEVLKLCTHYLGEKGEVLPLDEAARERILSQNRDMAQRALRVLAAAKREYERRPGSFEPSALESDLIFLGLCGMMDPVRPEVKAAIEECRAASIRPVMITGDHRDTAAAIALELGIISEASQAITGAELDELSEEELERRIEEFSVYARVQPEHKVRIVKAWRARGCVTAMTGDGVNDAPSIKAADIGVGMGITGTDVTKSVADMVLADDNFATIVNAVGEGRRIYDNIRKAIRFLLASNLSEVISIFAATVLGFTILNPVHILWINLITDSLPAIALGMEAEEPDVMRRPPRDPRDGIFAGGLGTDVAYQGPLVAVLTLAAYFIGHYMESGLWEITNSPDGMTMAFITMSMAEIFHSFNMRSARASVFSLPGHNLWLYGAMLLALALTVSLVYVPVLSAAFGLTVITLSEYAVAMALAFSVIPIVELVKACQRTYAHSKSSR
ncbi:MAG: cation-translocating P-type ATPase [Oscillospiraceae bacterium]|nr:cation-translocating P-type ATPase [Oscillospiraceae bacterium]